MVCPEHGHEDECDCVSTCPQCEEGARYSMQFDCYYCRACNAWTEPICSDEDCEYCSDRPELPYDAWIGGTP